MTRPPADVKSIFGNALDLPDEDRPEYLDSACGGDAVLRAELARLLDAHARAGGVLGPGPAGDPATSLPDGRTPFFPPTRAWDEAAAATLAGPGAGTVVGGRYVLAEPVGEGGMGSVWRADQTEPVRREVAVKLVKPGMDTRQVLARFDAERQALARMDHPHIATVLDAGTTADGRPFFVMELVRGVPITRYCDDHRLTVRERLELFAPVCEAVQHAHQKGVIHRDIKPSNVLVAEYDGKPVPKVIDFGVAKAAGAGGAGPTFHTLAGVVVGTPAYMAPEQAALDDADVDTRADVYGLGALLYELLAGSPPFLPADLGKAGLLEVLRVVREQDPPRPSDRLSTADTLPGLAVARGTDARRLPGLVRSDLDWVVMKALEKDRTRRYETVNGFAADVRRYLAGEPVRAAPPGRAYRARKFVRRNRGPVAAAALLALALAVGAVGTTVGLVRAEVARGEAVEAGRKAEDARAAAVAERDAKEAAREAEAVQRQRADGERKRADEEREVAEAVSAFLRDDLLGQPGATGDWTWNLTAEPTTRVLVLLDRAAATVGEKFRDRPPVEAAVRRAIGEGYVGAAESAKGVPQLERAAELLAAFRPPGHPDRLAVRRNLAFAYNSARRPYEAHALYAQLLAFHEAAHPDDPDHPDVLRACLDLAYISRALPDTRRVIHDLLERVRLGRQRAYGPGHPVAVRAEHELAYVDGDVARMTTLLPVLEGLATRGGGDARAQLYDAHRLADAYEMCGRPADAEKWYETVRGRALAADGPKSRHAVRATAQLARVYQQLGRHDACVRALEEVWDFHRTEYGVINTDCLLCVRDLALAHHHAGRPAAAARLLEEYLPAARRAWGRYDPMSFQWLSILSNMHTAAGRRDDALAVRDEFFSELLVPARDAGDRRDFELRRMGQRGTRTGEPAGIADALRAWLAGRVRADPTHWTRFSAETLLGAALLNQGQDEEAERLLLSGYRGLDALGPDLPPAGRVRRAEAVDRLVELSAGRGDLLGRAWWAAVRSTYPPPEAPAPCPVWR